MNNVDLKKAAVSLLPYFLRKKKMLEWLEVLVSPFVLIKDTSLSYREVTLKNIFLQPQKSAFENYLNDLYDNDSRRIYIENADFLQHTFLFNSIEDTVPSYIYNYLDEDAALDYDVGDYVAFEEYVYRCFELFDPIPGYLLTFENINKNDYSREIIYMNPLYFYLENALIAYADPVQPPSDDYTIDNYSLRLRGYGDSLFETAEAIQGVRRISFKVRQYGSDDQIEWIIEKEEVPYNPQAPADPGDPGFWSGDTSHRNYVEVGRFTPTTDRVPQTIEFDINYEGPVNLKITPADKANFSREYRCNIDNFRIETYTTPRLIESFVIAENLEILYNITYLSNKYSFILYHPFAEGSIETIRINNVLKRHTPVIKKFELKQIQ